MEFQHAFHDWEDTVEFDAQATIFSEGDAADVLFVILSGEVELKLHGESLGVEKAGGIIGEMALIPSAVCNATAQALTRVRLARLDRQQLGEVVNQNSEFSLHVMAVLANRLRAVNRFIATQL